MPVLPLYQILARDMGEHAAGRGHPVDLREIPDRRVHELLGDDAVRHDALVGVDVPEECVERVDALLEPGLQPVVFVGFDDARNRVVGKQPVMVFAVVIDAEAHAVTAELPIDQFPAIHQIAGELAGRRLHCHPYSLPLRVRICRRLSGRGHHYGTVVWFGFGGMQFMFPAHDAG